MGMGFWKKSTFSTLRQKRVRNRDKNNKKSGFLVKNREFWKNGVFVRLVDWVEEGRKWKIEKNFM